MADDYGLWIVDGTSSTNRGTSASVVITTPSAYDTQLPGKYLVYDVPSLVWYGLIGMKGSYVNNLVNFEAGVYFNYDGKLYLFQKGNCLTGQNNEGWDTALISNSPMYNTAITINIDCRCLTQNKVYITATWANGSASLTPSITNGSSYAQGVTFSKEFTLASNSQFCLNELWYPPYLLAHHKAYVTNYKMGPVKVYDRNDTLIDTINGGKNYHTLANGPGVNCVLPGNPIVSSSGGTDTVTFDLRI